MTVSLGSQPQSPSMNHPNYWWYEGRSRMLQTIVEPLLGDPRRVLDVGSADGPSVSWMQDRGKRVAIDLDYDALGPGDVCGSAEQLPFADGTFDVITAFDVLEHCPAEGRAIAEFLRVLEPGGRLFIAVPAYQWAWTMFDTEVGHYRRYTRRRLVAALERAGLEVERATYMFAGTLPFFTAERLVRKLRHRVQQETTSLPQPSSGIEKVLLGLCDLDSKLLRRHNLAMGSSVVAAARKRA